MKFHRRRDKEIILSIFILLTSVTVSAGAYSRMRERAEASHYLIEGLSEGVHKIVIMQGAACVGEVEAKVEYVKRELSISAEGQLRTTLSGQQVGATAKAQIDFNSLGQLVASFLRIDAADVSLTLGTTNPNPITVHARSQRGSQTWRMDTDIPGPLELREQGEGIFAVIYRHFPHIGSRVSAVGEQPLVKMLNMRLLEIGKSGSPCSEGATGVLDLNGISLLLGAFTNGIPLGGF